MKTSHKTLLLFWRANRAHGWLLAGAVICTVLGIAIQRVLAPLLIALTIGKLVSLHTQPVADYWAVFIPYLAGLGGGALLGQILNDIGLTLLAKLQIEAWQDLRMQTFDVLMQHSLGFHADNFSGSLVSQTNKLASAYVGITNIFIVNVVSIVVVSISAMAVVAYFFPFVALAMVLWTVFFTWLNITLTKQRVNLARRAAAAESVITGHLADTISNVTAVKSFAREAEESRLHLVKNQDRAAKRYASWRKAVQNNFVFGVMTIGLQLGVLAIIVYLATETRVDFGVLILLQIYILQLISQLAGLSILTRDVEQSLADAAEMTELLDKDYEVKDVAKPGRFSVAKGAIDFARITFTHENNKQALFQDFNLSIKPGEKVGVVGHSGSGKTTLTKLLLRFTDVASGTISIDGQDISTVRQADLRRHIAYVPQEPLLFHRSLFDNIAYGRAKAAKKQVFAAAKQAHADEFISSLPQGYKTMVGERGVKLSGGQRQRVAIARAILKDAPILVLDEATSALDSESEQLIQKALWRLMKGRTAIVIAHRLSTIQRMDRIIVLQDGKIVEEGAHEALLAKNGVYQRLWRHQSGGFIKQ